jgi:hypothetical protein
MDVAIVRSTLALCLWIILYVVLAIVLSRLAPR